MEGDEGVVRMDAMRMASPQLHEPTGWRGWVGERVAFLVRVQCARVAPPQKKTMHAQRWLKSSLINAMASKNSVQ